MKEKLKELEKQILKIKKRVENIPTPNNPMFCELVKIGNC